MKTRDSDHPLALWLEKQGLTAYEWARDNGLGVATVYRLMGGSSASQMITLERVEYATCGEVSMRQMFDWYIQNKPAQQGTAKYADAV